MRELLRGKARAIMAAHGVVHMNKRRFGLHGGVIVTLPSYFATHWREVAARG